MRLKIAHARLLAALASSSLAACFARTAPQQNTIYVPAVATYPAYGAPYTPAYDGFQPAAGVIAQPSTLRPPRTSCTNLGEARSCTSW